MEETGGACRRHPVERYRRSLFLWKEESLMKTNSPLRRLAEGGLIAAMYAALTLAVPAAAFGAVQFRVSEMLTILPAFTPAAIPGLAVGCLVSNLVGLMMGANPAGAWDILLGPLATLIAALLTYRLRGAKIKGLPVLATLPPVLVNAVVIGLGQLAACTVCGLVLYAALDRSGAAKLVFGK